MVTPGKLQKKTKQILIKLMTWRDRVIKRPLASIKSDLQEIKESLQKTVKVCDLESMVTNIVKGLLKNYEEEAEKRETQLKTKIDRLTTDVDKLNNGK
jgi:hypothetical protein